MKDFRLMPDKSDHRLQIFLPPEDRIGTEQNGIYTCVCVWEHHGHIYNSSGSYQLQRKGCLLWESVSCICLSSLYSRSAVFIEEFDFLTFYLIYNLNLFAELTRHFAPTFQYPLNNCVEFVDLGKNEHEYFHLYKYCVVKEVFAPSYSFR